MSNQFFLLLFTHFIQPGKKPVSHLLTPPILPFFCLQDKLRAHPQHSGFLLLFLHTAVVELPCFLFPLFLAEKACLTFPSLRACVYVTHRALVDTSAHIENF